MTTRSPSVALAARIRSCSSSFEARWYSTGIAALARRPDRDDVAHRRAGAVLQHGVELPRALGERRAAGLGRFARGVASGGPDELDRLVDGWHGRLLPDQVRFASGPLSASSMDAVVAVQARRTVASPGDVLVGGDDAARGLDLAAEVGRVDRLAEHDLVHLAQLAEREGLAEERVRDPAVLELVAEPPERVLDDPVVIEGELGQLVGGEPAHVGALGGELRQFLAHERPVDDRDDPAGGRTLDVAEGVELLEVGRRELGGLEELAGGGLARGSRPHPPIRRAAPTGRRTARACGARAGSRAPSAPPRRRAAGRRSRWRPRVRCS